MKSVLTLIVALLALTLPAAVRAQAANSGHVALELGAQGAAVPGKTLYIALHQKIAPKWHTYWRNPGDAGEPPRVTWTLPPGWKAGAFVWPAPKRLPLPPLMDYGFEDEVLLPVPVSVPASAKPGGKVQVRAAVSLLVCQAVCVPEQAQLSLTVPVSAGPAPNVRWGPTISRALAAAPKAGVLRATYAVQGKSVKLSVLGAAATGARDAYFFPYSPTLIGHAAPQGVERGRAGLTLTLAPASDFAAGKSPPLVNGVLTVNGQAFEIQARRGAPLTATAGLGAPPGLAVGGATDATPSFAGGAGLGLPLAGVFAFLGGVVLNLMPCVFPILSMKALAVARHGENRDQARVEGAAFLGGVLATFLALAAAILILRGLGAGIGWGFQLQSPAVVAILAVLMLLIALNLSGVFEAGLSLQRIGGAATPAGGATGAFLTGALAVVVAAPCTAPLMAAAVAYGLTQGPVAALVVFTALGLGFAAPFTLIAFVPALQRRLPRPGAWMDTLKKVLAFPMYGAAAWLLWVFSLQTSPPAMAALLAAGVVTGLVAWLFGVAQARHAEGRPVLSLQVATGLAAVAAAALVVSGVTAPASAGPAAATAGGGGLPALAWSEQALADLQTQGRPVLVDFTAAWCVTCQVNERVALSSARVAQAFKSSNAVYMRADWTRRDPAIAQALAKAGRAGVPLYLVYPKGGGAPAVLPQVLTEDTVVAAIRKAAA